MFDALLSVFSTEHFVRHSYSKVDPFLDQLTKGELQVCTSRLQEVITLILIMPNTESLQSQLRSDLLKRNRDGYFSELRYTSKKGNEFRQLFDRFAVEASPRAGKGENSYLSLGLSLCILPLAVH